MSDAKPALGKADHDSPRLPATVNALWIGGAAALDLKTAAHAFEHLVAAARLAPGLWPDLYEGAGTARLVHSAAAPPPSEIAEAARACGMTLAPSDVTPESAAEQCDLALATLPAAVDLVGGLPILTVAPNGADAGLAIHDVGSSLLSAARRWTQPSKAASPSDLARAILSPPRAFGETTKLRDYVKEDTRATAARFEYEFLLRLIGEKSPAAAPDHSWESSWESAAALAQRAGPASAARIAALQAEYRRADAQALAYGQRWRSTLATRSFMLFLGSVMSGLVGTLFPWLVVVTIPIQVVATALIFADRRFAGRRRWRQKWLEYRRLAESARIARFCMLAGAPLPGAGSAYWIDWRLHRAIRAAPPLDALREEQAPDVLAHLRTVEIADQIAYHHAAFRRFRRLDARFKRAAAVALFSTVAIGAVFAILALTGTGRIVPLTSALSLALSAAPSLYAALDSLRSQLDVTRQAQRSGRIAAGLRRLARDLSDAPASAALARAAALRAADIMREDVTSWERVMGVV
jgi:hypothetical protein